MHNKVFAVDGSAAIIGGRNLSNEYFGADPCFNFRDVDVLITGPAVSEIMQSFDEYWHSEWAVPLKDLHKRRIRPLVVEALEEGLSKDDSSLLARIDALPIKHYLSRVASQISWCEIEVLADAPRKMKGQAGFVSPVRKRIFELSAAAQAEILIENGYFIPGDVGLAQLCEVLARGIQVKVLTNSLASNDTGLSHAGYQRYRRHILRAGIELYEFRVDADLAKDFQLGGREGGEIGLHSKAATLDREIAFVGSYNLDPRSAFINTEIGVVVHHKGFARELADVILKGMSRDNSWWLRLTSDNCVQWQSEALVTSEPRAGWRKRLLAGLLSLLPVERHL